jgi:hypothetical protein
MVQKPNIQVQEPQMIQGHGEQDLEEDLAIAQQQHQNPEMIELNDEQEELDVDEQPFQLDEVEDVPEIGAELEIEQDPIPSNQDRRTGREKQYNARNREFRHSLNRPLAKLGLIGMVIFHLLIFLFFNLNAE